MTYNLERREGVAFYLDSASLRQRERILLMRKALDLDGWDPGRSKNHLVLTDKRPEAHDCCKAGLGKSKCGWYPLIEREARIAIVAYA